MSISSTNNTNNNKDNRLILYFTGIITVMFLLVGTFYMLQILKIQSNQAILLAKIDQGVDIRHKEHLQILNLSEQILNYTSHVTK